MKNKKNINKKDISKKIKKTRYFSYKLNELPKGCQYCVKGSKLVLFITGLCPRSCYYCPISDKKYKKDVIYADEWPVKNIKDMIKEARSINAEGAGITGGDPLKRLSRTVLYIKRLKKEFGRKFHIHLYTSFDLVSEKILKKLYKAGLDEIRFHADINNKKLWKKIFLVKKFDWDIGIEIPVIPKQLKKTKELVNFFSDKVNFINLNELEIADNKVNKLSRLGFKTKDSLSYAIKGSEKDALDILKYISKKYPGLNVHYCTATLKDKIQMTNRIKRRAKNIAFGFDKITKQGTLKRGIIYLKEMAPSFGYKNRLEKLSKKEQKNMVKRLEKKKKDISKKIKETKIDKRKMRIITDQKKLRKNKDYLKEKGLIPAIVEEYPTYDSIEVEINFL